MFSWLLEVLPTHLKGRQSRKGMHGKMLKTNKQCLTLSTINQKSFKIISYSKIFKEQSLKLPRCIHCTHYWHLLGQFLSRDFDEVAMMRQNFLLPWQHHALNLPSDCLVWQRGSIESTEQVNIQHFELENHLQIAECLLPSLGRPGTAAQILFNLRSGICCVGQNSNHVNYST